MDPVDLKKWRERNGTTQKQLAGSLGVNKITLCRWETGFSPIPNFLPLALAELERQLIVNRKEVKRDGSKNSRKKTG
jgi:DNA-binding XRE family transcriptional regulator